MAGIVVVASIGAAACTSRSVATDGGGGARDGVWLDVDALGADGSNADGSSLCSGPTTLALNDQRVPVSSIRVVVTQYFDPMIAFGSTAFDITGGLPLSSGEQGLIDVHYVGDYGLYDGNGPLVVWKYPNRLVSLYRCESAACKSKTPVEELSTSDLKSLTGWVTSDPAKRRVSFCMDVNAQDLAAHPRLGRVRLYLNAVEATFKKDHGG